MLELTKIALLRLPKGLLLKTLPRLKSFWLLYGVLVAPFWTGSRDGVWKALSVMSACAFCAQ